MLSFRHVKQTSKNVADTTFNMLVTKLCQTVIHKLKVLGEGNLNIIYKSLVEPQKGDTKFLNFSGQTKGGGPDLGLKFTEGEILEETMYKGMARCKRILRKGTVNHQIR